VPLCNFPDTCDAQLTTAFLLVMLGGLGPLFCQVLSVWVFTRQIIWKAQYE